MRRSVLLVAVTVTALVGCGATAATTPTQTPSSLSVSSTAITTASAATTTTSTATSATTGAESSATPEPSTGTAGPEPGGPTASVEATPPAAAQPAPEPAPAAEPAPAPEPVPTSSFTGSVSPIDDILAARMAASWRSGCPVDLGDLRYLSLTYRGFDGADHQGELVVAASVADDVVTVFHRLYDNGYPIASMRLVDDFGGSDDASMAADNTSAFNCRPVTGGGGWSEHSYGTAVDLNPVENPYVSGGTVLPPAGGGYTGRPDAPGVIHDGDATVSAFGSIGWSWGGYWSRPTDYQHFSQSGR